MICHRRSEKGAKLIEKSSKIQKNKRFSIVGVKKEYNLLEKSGHFYKLIIYYLAATTG